MCILYLYVAAQPCQKVHKTSLKFILASNRDEFYSRHTLPLCFWEPNNAILAGQDGKEGGTWLGMTKKGKIAALLNIMGGTIPNDPDNPKRSRGSLTTDFLRSPPGLNGWTYCNNLYNDPDLAIREKLDRFNLITIDLLNTPTESDDAGTQEQTNSSSKEVKTGTDETDKSTLATDHVIYPTAITYLTNASEQGPIKLIPNNHKGKSQVFTFGNSVYDKPFRRVTGGCKQFENIVNKHIHNENSICGENKSQLKDDILQFLKSTEQYFPDPQLEMQATVSKDCWPQMCGRFIKLPKEGYGTRTHSIIIVDSENHVEFYESTIQEPIDIENPLWKDSKYEFTLSQ